MMDRMKTLLDQALTAEQRDMLLAHDAALECTRANQELDEVIDSSAKVADTLNRALTARHDALGEWSRALKPSYRGVGDEGDEGAGGSCKSE